MYWWGLFSQHPRKDADQKGGILDFRETSALQIGTKLVPLVNNNDGAIVENVLGLRMRSEMFSEFQEAISRKNHYDANSTLWT